MMHGVIRAGNNNEQTPRDDIRSGISFICTQLIRMNPCPTFDLPNLPVNRSYAVLRGSCVCTIAIHIPFD